LRSRTLICIVGPDGVGKTTHARLLVKAYRNNGIRSDYVWMRFHHILSLPLLALARRSGLTEIQRYTNGRKAVYHNFGRVKPFAMAYRWLLLVDTLIAIMIKVYPKVALGSTVVCDRFVYDTLVDLIISTNDTKVLRYFTTRLFLSLASKSKAVVMIADPEALKARREDVLHDRNLNLRMELYKSLSIRFGLPVVWASGSICEVHDVLLKTLGLGLRFRAPMKACRLPQQLIEKG